MHRQKHSEIAKKKMSIAHKGKKATVEAKRKMSENNSRYWEGKKFSEEHKRKLSKSRLGLQNHKGKHHSEETKKRLSEANKGKHLSDETKRKISERMKGKKNYFWQGGKSFEKYTLDWTKTLRISIRERDKYTCQLCGEKQGDRAFSVHHIDYNKKNCNPENLTTLCINCHQKTNFNRKYWTKYFKRSFNQQNN